MSNAALIPAISARRISPAQGEFAVDFLEGLHKRHKQLPCKYFYDEEGSRLFDLICELPEYYPTRTEMKLLRNHAHEMAALIGEDVELIEFGAGSLQKIGTLLEAMPKLRGYTPIDISGDYLRAMAAKLGRTFPSLAIHPVVGDFTKAISLAPGAHRRVGFFPGSTIGNFDPLEARAFLHRAAKMLKGGGLLIGVDLVKDPAILHAAYNDAAGVTERFNKNLLVRANRELDADFDPDAFAHYAFYEPRASRIEMHLLSLERQHVTVAGETIAFADGETVHTENSYKYTVERFRALATDAGFTPRAFWCDPDRLFSLHWLAC
jgi:L-histidine Nalpha-methyltransferase